MATHNAPLRNFLVHLISLDWGSRSTKILFFTFLHINKRESYVMWWVFCWCICFDVPLVWKSQFWNCCLLHEQGALQLKNVDKFVYTILYGGIFLRSLLNFFYDSKFRNNCDKRKKIIIFLKISSNDFN